MTYLFSCPDDSTTLRSIGDVPGEVISCITTHEGETVVRWGIVQDPIPPAAHVLAQLGVAAVRPDDAEPPHWIDPDDLVGNLTDRGALIAIMQGVDRAVMVLTAEVVRLSKYELLHQIAEWATSTRDAIVQHSDELQHLPDVKSSNPLESDAGEG